MFQRNGQLLYKRFAEYFLPTVLMAVALSMSIVVDGIIVGNLLGPQALAAVNLGSPLITLYSVVFSLLGAGGSILVAFYKGRQEAANADAVFTAACACLALMSLLLVAFGWLFRTELAGVLVGHEADLQTLVSRFLWPLIVGAPLLVLIPGLSFFMRTDGRPNLAAAMLIVANGVNLVCDVLFIRWWDDIEAASWATVAGYAAGAVFLVAWGRSPRRSLHLAGSGSIRQHLALSATIFKTGLPSGLGMLFTFVKIFCINRLVLAVAGEAGMIAFSVCIACWSLASMFIAGASQTMMPMIGVLHGEGDFQGIRFVFRRALTVLLGATALLVLLLEAFPGSLLGFFGIHDAQNLATGTAAIRLFAPSLVGLAFTFLMLYYTQTVRRQKMAMTISAVEGLLVVVPAAWLLSRALGLSGVWLAFWVAELASVGVIFWQARRVRAASSGTLKGLLMLPGNREALATLDVSIRNLVAEAVTLSRTVSRFCRDHGLDSLTATRLGLAVEELAVNTARHGGGQPGKHYLDIAVCLKAQEACISFRDDGKPFNPLGYLKANENSRNPDVSGLSLVRQIAERWDYAHTLGFNTTRLIVNIPVKAGMAVQCP
ncbi:MAG: ATP-binding protein [Zoogloeaceae bacterium]|jgi:Na+-driven multidrug efflux pump/anti-sigma regulatory factor (Ser/Thr protein kinase)|nr:ATP-binding protein [Zoogloeaceae bacterium]